MNTTEKTANTTNINIDLFAKEIGQLVGQNIKAENIHPTAEGRYFYTQAPKPGAPELLHHYRGPFFIDIHPDDFERISFGDVSAIEYIQSANWLIGYYWGGGSMIGGGFYQPFDIVGRSDEVRRYFRILSCRGNKRSSGYTPNEGFCANCPIQDCPVSCYKHGTWENELSEEDSRLDLFKALNKRFEQENPGYSLQGFTSGKIPDNEIWLSPNGHCSEKEPFTFTVHASNALIQSLLMHETNPEDWDKYVEGFQFRIFHQIERVVVDLTKDTLATAFEGLDYVKKAPMKHVHVSGEEEIEEKVSLTTRVVNFFKNMF